MKIVAGILSILVAIKGFYEGRIGTSYNQGSAAIVFSTIILIFGIFCLLPVKKKRDKK